MHGTLLAAGAAAGNPLTNPVVIAALVIGLALGWKCNDWFNQLAWGAWTGRLMGVFAAIGVIATLIFVVQITTKVH